MLHPIDLAILAAWLLFTVGAGLYFSRRASASTESFFVSDRSLPWWAVGTSMVATTFAADTPLVVSGWVASKGISENWTWWIMGLSGPVAVFLFARLWRRARVVTDAELVELRYAGVSGVVLRGLRSVWFGAFYNLLVIAWVMRAVTKIVVVVTGMEPGAEIMGMQAEVAVVLGLFVLTVFYTVTAGLWGVVATDVLQFVVAIVAAVALAVLAWIEVGGREGMVAGFARHGFDWTSTTALVPLTSETPAAQTETFVILVAVVWWTARNVDGGGYLAQRLFAARDDRHALWAYLWFTIAHICLRPWPWIVVGLAGMAMLGPLDDPETYYPRMMVQLLGPGWLGLMVASFLAAFMSTIDTQLNWGSSLVVNDLYERFLAPGRTEAHYVLVSRIVIVLLALLGALVSFSITEIGFAWQLALSVTAGLGTVYVARWYWWRVNGWAEITAMVSAGVLTGVFFWLEVQHPANGGTADWLASVPTRRLLFPWNTAIIALAGIPAWVAVALLTSGPSDIPHLRRFYARVRPGGPGWRRVAGDMPGFEQDGPTRGTFLGIAGAVVAIYGVLLGVGQVLIGDPWLGVLGLAAAAGGAFVAGRQVRRETFGAPYEAVPSNKP